jgi:hypothetical protein
METKDILEELDLNQEIENLEEIQHKNFENLENNIITEEVIINKSNEELKNELDLLLKEAHKTIDKEEKNNKIFSYII